MMVTGVERENHLYMLASSGFSMMIVDTFTQAMDDLEDIDTAYRYIFSKEVFFNLWWWSVLKNCCYLGGSEPENWVKVGVVGPLMKLLMAVKAAIAINMTVTPITTRVSSPCKWANGSQHSARWSQCYVVVCQPLALLRLVPGLNRSVWVLWVNQNWHSWPLLCGLWIFKLRWFGDWLSVRRWWKRWWRWSRRWRPGCCEQWMASRSARPCSAAV